MQETRHNPSLIRPRLPAYPRTDDVAGLRVWCCWCDRWHYHSTGYGHRAAHCHKRTSPYRVTGYVLTSPAVIERKDGQQ